MFLSIRDNAGLGDGSLITTHMLQRLWRRLQEDVPKILPSSSSSSSSADAAKDKV